MKNFMTYLTLIFFFVTTAALAAVITDDKLELGKPSSSANKELVFSGPTKKKLTHTNATNTLVYDGNNLTVGDGANTSKVLKFNKGASSPEIRYNSGTSKLEFSNDASVYKAIGSGTGGGSGINLLDNSGFEDGVAVSWTTSGTSLVEVTSGANLLYELKSASWTPTATAHFFESTAVTVPNILYGVSCMAKITYKGGDANAYLTIMDGTSAEIIPTNTRAILNATTGVKDAKIYFTCPSSGSIKMRVQSTAAMAIGYFDQAHLGQADFVQSKQAQFVGSINIDNVAGCTFQGTATSFTNFPVVAACFAPTATGSVLTNGKAPSLIIPNARPGNYYFVATGNFQKFNSADAVVQFRFTDGVSSTAPNAIRNNTSFSGTGTITGNLNLTTDTANWTINMQGVTTSAGVAYAIDNTISGAQLSIAVYYYPSGSDTVINSKCPNDVSCENTFTAQVSSGGVVSSENLDWLNGNCSGTSPYTCIFNTNIFTNTPNCTATVVDNTTVVVARITGATSGTVVVQTVNTAFATANGAFSLTCQKSTADFKAKQNIQGFLANTVTSALNNMRIEYVSFGGGSMGANCTTTPCTIFANSGPFVSVTRGGTGLYTLNITPGTFSAYPICTTRGFLNGATGNANLNASGSGQDLFNPVNSNAINFGLFNAQTAALADGSGIITCVGPR